MDILEKVVLSSIGAAATIRQRFSGPYMKGAFVQPIVPFTDIAFSAEF